MFNAIAIEILSVMRSVELSGPFLLLLFLSIDASAPFFTVSPGIKHRELGGRVAFSCSGYGDNFEKIYWNFRGQRVNNSKWFHLIPKSDGSTLLVTNVTDGLDGDYCCWLDNGYKTWESCGALKIKRAPAITREPMSRSTVVGKDVNFTCGVSAHPTPTIAWLHNGKIICRENTNKYCTLVTRNYSTHFGILDIFDVSLDDAGSYQCNATNSLGLVYSNFAEFKVEEISQKYLRIGTITKARLANLDDTATVPTSVQSSVTMDLIQIVANVTSYLIFSSTEHQNLANGHSTALIVVFLGITLLVVLLLFFVCVRKKEVHICRTVRIGGRSNLKRWSINDNNHAALQRLEYPMENLDFVQELGEGVFGLVYKARAPGLLVPHETATVAAKVVRPCDQQKQSKLLDFNREAELLATFHHQNVIQLLGICINSETANDIHSISCLLFEYIDGGDLCAYLRNNGPNRAFFGTIQNSGLPRVEITERDKLAMCTHIACGMQYLSERNFIHRDLATRNCLISAADCNIKIADFGLSRRTYESDYYKAGDTESVPIRWMSPEAILYGRYSAQSDVWAYGVTIWEIYTYALQPYFSLSNEEVICCVCKAKVLSPPPDVPPWMYNLMQLCWQHSPENRPNFSTIHSVMQAISLSNGNLPTQNIVSADDAENVSQTQDMYVNLRRENMSPQASNSELSVVRSLPRPHTYRPDFQHSRENDIRDENLSPFTTNARGIREISLCKTSDFSPSATIEPSSRIANPSLKPLLGVVSDAVARKPNTRFDRFSHGPTMAPMTLNNTIQDSKNGTIFSASPISTATSDNCGSDRESVI